jgi:cytidine deaminase
MSDKMPDWAIEMMIGTAKRFRLMAYCPYSEYAVGAAVWAVNPAVPESGRVFGGCNVENASYGLTICAERVAIFHAVAFGYTDIRYMVIHTENGGMSCGACRQVEREFNPDMKILTFGKDHIFQEYNLKQELPHAFGPEFLK